MARPTPIMAAGRDRKRPQDGCSSHLPFCARFPFFSPNGEWVAFFAGGKLLKIESAGGKPETLCDAPAGRGGSWGEDGSIIASLNATGGLFRVSASGGMPRPVADLKGSQGVIGQRWPQILPGSTGDVYLGSFSPRRQMADVPPNRSAYRGRPLDSSGGAYTRWVAARAAETPTAAGGAATSARHLAGRTLGGLLLRRNGAR